MNPKFNWEPVEVSEERGDVITPAACGEHVVSGVLDVMKFIEDCVR